MTFTTLLEPSLRADSLCWDCARKAAAVAHKRRRRTSLSTIVSPSETTSSKKSQLIVSSPPIRHSTLLTQKQDSSLSRRPTIDSLRSLATASRKISSRVPSMLLFSILLLTILSPVAALPQKSVASEEAQSAYQTTTRKEFSTTIRPTATGSITSAAPLPTTSGTGLSTDPGLGSTDVTLPLPFDFPLGSNYTEATKQSCPQFLSDTVNNATFISCLPFSSLVVNSKSFFSAQQSGPLILTRTLDAACSPPPTLPVCSALMATLAHELSLSTTCGPDLARLQPLVLATYNALLTYDLMYSVSCLKGSTGGYCYVDAATNNTNPGSSYLYFLGAGTNLPGGSRITCNECAERVMAVYASQAGNKTQPVSKVYNNAAQQVNVGCGPGFANTSIAATSAGPVLRPTGGAWLASLVSTVVVGLGMMML